MEEDKNIIEILENTCQDWYYFVDDDIGGHFEKVIGNQIANTNLNYLTFKNKLEDMTKRYKELKENSVDLETLKNFERTIAYKAGHVKMNMTVSEMLIYRSAIEDLIENIEKRKKE